MRRLCRPTTSGKALARTSTRSVAIALALAVLAAAPPEGKAQTLPFRVGPVTAARGLVASGAITVDGPDGSGALIPITIIHGLREGPVLALVAGVHGAEYAPILALQRFRGAVDPARLKGTLILVHVANMPSFLGRTIYYSPADGKNLNRVFPGRPDGTLSERIAHAITAEVIERATHVVDLHCGDGNESLRPYTYWITTGSPEVAQAGREMALAFGLDHIVIDRERPTDPNASVYLSNTAITRGKPALTIESGALAQTDESSIVRIERGLLGLLRHLEMSDVGPPPVAHPVWIARSEVLRSRSTGIFFPAVERGHTVTTGTLVGHITDFHGRIVEEIRAPFGGEILYVIGTPPISAGEPVAFVGEVGAAATSGAGR